MDHPATVEILTELRNTLSAEPGQFEVLQVSE